MAAWCIRLSNPQKVQKWAEARLSVTAVALLLSSSLTAQPSAQACNMCAICMINETLATAGARRQWCFQFVLKCWSLRICFVPFSKNGVAGVSQYRKSHCRVLLVNLYVVNKVAAARGARHTAVLQYIQSWVGSNKSDLPFCKCPQFCFCLSRSKSERISRE